MEPSAFARLSRADAALDFGAAPAGAETASAKLTPSGDPQAVIFLDIDGVLNRTHTATHVRLEDDLVERLRRIMEAVPEASIVFSTFWRHFTSYLAYVLWREGIPATRIYGVTQGWDSSLVGPHMRWPCVEADATRFGSRAKEIRQWLRDHPTVQQILILDDKAYAADDHLMPYFVRTTAHIGLTDKDVEDAVDILRNRTVDAKLM